LALLKGAGLDELPYPIVGPLQAWFTGLGVRTDTLFRAELLANYELRSIDDIAYKGVRNPSHSLSTALAGIQWPILRVTVPARALGISTHFAIVAHELGHALFGRVNWNLDPIADDLDQLKSNVATRLGVAGLDANSFKFLQEVFVDWFQEIACDAFALLLTGPAFFFSLGDFFQLSLSGYGISKTHPASDLRRRLIYDKLIQGGDNSYASVFNKWTGAKLTDDFNSPLMRRVPDSNTVFNHTRSTFGGKTVYSDEQAHIMAELHDFMPVAAPVVFSCVEDFLVTNAPMEVYTAEKYNEDLKTHLEPLLLAIPPIESGVNLDDREPAGFASILNVGWAVLLTKLDDLQVRVEEDPLRAERLEKLHGLLLKAVELSEARKAWGNA
jgi:hypothetical protein